MLFLLNAVIGVATGSTPELAYALLADKIQEHNTDVSQLQFFALDEYIGLSWDHPESYHAVINRTVTEPLKVDPSQVHIPEAGDDSTEGPVRYYDEKIAEAKSYADTAEAEINKEKTGENQHND